MDGDGRRKDDTTMEQKITTHLWFNGNAEEAVTQYIALFPDSRVVQVNRWGDAGPRAQGDGAQHGVRTGRAALHGPQRGPAVQVHAGHLAVRVVRDAGGGRRLWDGLLAGGGKPTQCGWLVRVASRRIADHARAEAARRYREALVVSLVPVDEQIALAADVAHPEGDDTLDLVFLCCHPSLTPASAVALTLRAVGGLTTAEIARAFLVPEATMAQRISRARQTVKASGFPSKRAPRPSECNACAR